MMKSQTLLKFESILNNHQHLSDTFKTSVLSSARATLSKLDNSSSPASYLRAIFDNLSDKTLEVMFNI